MAMEEAKVVDALPPPPSYYKLFAPDAAEDAEETGEHGSPAEAGGPGAFPLEPPPPPGPGETYRMFGMPYSAEPVELELLPPEKMVIPTSGQHTDFRAEMKTLLNSIMANYGQFMEMLVSSPSRAHEKLSDVETLFVNFHSLLNRYRAHQARHLILERLRGQAEENAAVASALEAAMLQCVSAQEGATACLRVSNGTATVAAGVPMDVVEDYVAGGPDKSNGGSLAGNGKMGVDGVVAAAREGAGLEGMWDGRESENR